MSIIKLILFYLIAFQQTDAEKILDMNLQNIAQQDYVFFRTVRANELPKNLSNLFYRDSLRRSILHLPSSTLEVYEHIDEEALLSLRNQSENILSYNISDFYLNSKFKITNRECGSLQNGVGKVWKLGIPMISTDKKYSFLYVEECSGDLSGSAQINIYRKTDENWVMVGLIMLYIS